MQKLFNFVLDVVISITYGICFALITKYALHWMWLYAFMVPGFAYIFYGIIEFLRVGPETIGKVPAASGNSSQNESQTSLLDMQANVEVQIQENGVRTPPHKVYLERNWFTIFIQRSYYESFFVGIFLIWIAKMTY